MQLHLLNEKRRDFLKGHAAKNLEIIYLAPFSRCRVPRHISGAAVAATRAAGAASATIIAAVNLPATSALVQSLAFVMLFAAIRAGMFVTIRHNQSSPFKKIELLYIYAVKCCYGKIFGR